MMLTLSDYDHAKELLIEYINKRDDIVTAWQYGEISQPGVSDLDMMIIIKDKAHPMLNDYLRKDKLPLPVRDALAHANVIILPESSAEKVFYWDNIKCTDIRTKELVDVPQFDSEYLRLAMLVDWFFERSYRIYSMKHHKCSNKQLMLGMMKSYSYSVENFYSLCEGIEGSQYFNLKNRLVELRNNWISIESIDKEEVLEDLFEDFYKFAKKLHGIVFEWLDESSYYPKWNKDDNEITFNFPDGNVFLFSDYFSDETRFHKDNPIILLPKKLLHHFILYAMKDCQLSYKLRKSFMPHMPERNKKAEDCLGDYGNFLQKRIDCASSWYDCLKKNNFSYGLFKFGWYLKD